MAIDPEAVVPAADEVRQVALTWDTWGSAQARHEQREGARQAAAVLYARMSVGYPAAQWVVYRFLDAWREHLRLLLDGLAADLPLLTGTSLSLGGDDAFEHWAALQPLLLAVWPDAGEEAAVTARALMRLQTAFTAGRVDVAAVHREMLAASDFLSGLESLLVARLQFDRN